MIQVGLMTYISWYSVFSIPLAQKWAFLKCYDSLTAIFCSFFIILWTSFSIFFLCCSMDRFSLSAIFCCLLSADKTHAWLQAAALHSTSIRASSAKRKNKALVPHLNVLKMSYIAPCCADVCIFVKLKATLFHSNCAKGSNTVCFANNINTVCRHKSFNLYRYNYNNNTFVVIKK